MLKALTSQYSVDTNRVYVLWGSGSGAFVLDLLASHPHFFAAGMVQAATPQTGSITLDLAGSLHVFDGNVTQVTWDNLTKKTKGLATGTEEWTVRDIPLVGGRTNLLVVTATRDTTWAPAFEGTTTFSDTLAVFSNPVQVRLTLYGDGAMLDWTGGVPPFSVQRSPVLALNPAAWTEIATNVMRPVTLPMHGSAEFYRVLGQ